MYNFVPDWDGDSRAMTGWSNTTGQIYNNTFVNIPDRMWRLDGDLIALEVFNNLMWNTGRNRVSPSSSFHHNGWFSSERVPGEGDIAGTDPTIDEMYHLLAGSTAIGAGLDGVDLGAFPYEPGEHPPKSGGCLPVQKAWRWMSVAQRLRGAGGGK